MPNDLTPTPPDNVNAMALDGAAVPRTVATETKQEGGNAPDYSLRPPDNVGELVEAIKDELEGVDWAGTGSMAEGREDKAKVFAMLDKLSMSAERMLKERDELERSYKAYVAAYLVAHEERTALQAALSGMREEIREYDEANRDLMKSKDHFVAENERLREAPSPQG